MPSQTIAGLCLAAFVTLALAGCVAPEEYQSTQEPCRTPYVTTHYGAEEGAISPSQTEVQAAFIEAGYDWEPTRQGVAEVNRGDQRVVGVVSFAPGLSGEDLIVTAAATSPRTSATEVEREADALNAVVEESFPDLEAAQRVEDAWTHPCGQSPDPVEATGTGTEVADRREPVGGPASASDGVSDADASAS